MVAIPLAYQSCISLFGKRKKVDKKREKEDEESNTEIIVSSYKTKYFNQIGNVIELQINLNLPISLCLKNCHLISIFA